VAVAEFSLLAGGYSKSKAAALRRGIAALLLSLEFDARRCPVGQRGKRRTQHSGKCREDREEDAGGSEGARRTGRVCLAVVAVRPCAQCCARAPRLPLVQRAAGRIDDGGGPALYRTHRLERPRFPRSLQRQLHLREFRSGIGLWHGAARARVGPRGVCTCFGKGWTPRSSPVSDLDQQTRRYRTHGAWPVRPRAVSLPG